MGLGEIQDNLHRYYDRLTSGICLIGMEPGDPILFVNKGMLKIYHCVDEAEFYRFTGRRFQGMVDGEDYYPVAHMSEPDHSEFVTFRFRTRDEHFRRAEGAVSVVSLEDGKKVWLLQIISSDLKGSSTQNDPLTGLLGMRLFFKKALQVARRESPKGRLSILPISASIILSMAWPQATIASSALPICCASTFPIRLFPICQPMVLPCWLIKKTYSRR